MKSATMTSWTPEPRITRLSSSPSREVSSTVRSWPSPRRSTPLRNTMFADSSAGSVERRSYVPAGSTTSSPGSAASRAARMAAASSCESGSGSAPKSVTSRVLPVAGPGVGTSIGAPDRSTKPGTCQSPCSDGAGSTALSLSDGAGSTASSLSTGPSDSSRCMRSRGPPGQGPPTTNVPDLAGCSERIFSSYFSRPSLSLFVPLVAHGSSRKAVSPRAQHYAEARGLTIFGMPDYPYRVADIIPWPSSRLSFPFFSLLLYFLCSFPLPCCPFSCPC